MLPTLALIKRRMKVEVDDSHTSSMIKSDIIQYLEDKLERPDDMLFYKKAAFLDPRFKSKYGDVRDILIAELQESGRHKSTSLQCSNRLV